LSQRVDRSEARDFAGEAGKTDGIQHFIEILVSRRGFVFRIGPAIGHDIMRHEFVINRFLIGFADGGFAAFGATGSVVLPEIVVSCRADITSLSHNGYCFCEIGRSVE
jgi:hypothetical protein